MAASSGPRTWDGTWACPWVKRVRTTTTASPSGASFFPQVQVGCAPSAHSIATACVTAGPGRARWKPERPGAFAVMARPARGVSPTLVVPTSWCVRRSSRAVRSRCAASVPPRCRVTVCWCAWGSRAPGRAVSSREVCPMAACAPGRTTGPASPPIAPKPSSWTTPRGSSCAGSVRPTMIAKRLRRVSRRCSRKCLRREVFARTHHKRPSPAAVMRPSSTDASFREGRSPGARRLCARLKRWGARPRSR